MKKYLSDLMKDRILSKNKINLIEASCGCGKTTWFFKDLLPKYENRFKIVYLVDTNMLEDSMLEKYGDKMKVYDKLWRLEQVASAFHNDNRVVCMSYKKFGILIKKYPYLMDNIDLIVCDEVHNLTKYTHLKKREVKRILNVASENEIEKVMDIADELTYLIKTLMDCANEGKTQVVMLTATPFYIKKVYWDKFKYNLNIVVKLNELEGYTYENKIEYEHIQNVLNNISLNTNEKAIIYIPYISKIKKYVKLLENQGYRAIGLWSLNNIENPLTNEQIRVRDFIIKNEEIPKEYDFVLFNEAYTTGWNLTDNNKVVQHCFCHSKINEVQVQFRGRIRHNIKTFYFPSKVNNNNIKLSDKWLNKPLTKVLKDELCVELNIIDKCGRIRKWKSVSDMLINQGYVISDGKEPIDGKQTRCSRITKAN